MHFPKQILSVVVLLSMACSVGAADGLRGEGPAVAEHTGAAAMPALQRSAAVLQPCPWDLEGDGTVDPGDIAQVLGNWGPCPGCAADFNGNGVVTSADLAQVLGNWGPCPPLRCRSDAECDDNNACTLDDCDTVKSQCQYFDVVCDDLDPCTDDACDPEGGCFATPSPPPPNDDCADASPIFDGDTAYTNLCSSTDGPDEPDHCEEYLYTNIESDVWFVYEATCDGILTVGTCSNPTDYDTKLALYPAGACPPGLPAPLACNDDGPGCVDYTSEASTGVTLGQMILIRVGGYAGEQGSSVISILCDVNKGSPCPGAGDCCIDNGTPGCEDEDCCVAVCAIDAFCCDTSWDNICAGEAVDLCPGCSSSPCPGTGDCCSDNGTPGCADAKCCSAVCAVDSFCCNVTWDSVCADEAAAGLCPACGGSGDCCEVHATPGCNDPSCEAAVCDVFPFCCSDQWDTTCVGLAAALCGICN